MELDKKICPKCSTEKLHSDFYKNQRRCKICTTNASKKWVQNNKEKSNAFKKRYRDNNKELTLDYDKNKRPKRDYKKGAKVKKDRRATDSVYRFSTNLKESIRRAFKKINQKKPNSSEKILGCSIIFFRNYIENQFESWMTWENHGLYNPNKKTWQLDHKIPISLAKSIEDVSKLNHYTNFQPLETLENILKSNKI